jgi:GTP-binding protein
VVVNKIDRDGARPDWAIDQIFDLFDNLGASDEQLDFPVIYASALQGFAKLALDEASTDMSPLLNTIIDKVHPPKADNNGSLQMQISSLDYSSYMGMIGIGKISRGKITTGQQVSVVDHEGNVRYGKISQILGYLGLERKPIAEASAGDIVAIAGISDISISDTVCDKDAAEGLPPLTVDEPTISMTFQVNDSPFAGQDGKFVTSRQIRDRLMKEQLYNIALRVEETGDPDKFKVSGRGELHLGILIETMRREGFELAVSRPEVILREHNGVMEEPYEDLVIEVTEQHQGSIMQEIGARRGQLLDMLPDGKGRVRLNYTIPARGLIGFHSEFLTLTSGTGIMTHVFSKYGEMQASIDTERKNGVLISNANGKDSGYSLWNLQPRGKLFLGPQTEVYEGMIVGIHTRDNDLVVNVTKEKQLTNMRASGSDENIILSTPIKTTLEYALEFINGDELVEITPKAIRLRKRFLKEHERKRSGK